jgi:hypothetical protein
MGQSYGTRRIHDIFAGRTTFDFLSNMAISEAKPYLASQGAGLADKPIWGTGLAPRHHVRCPLNFLGLDNTSRTSLVRNNERYLAFYPAVFQAFLEVSDLRTQF